MEMLRPSVYTKIIDTETYTTEFKSLKDIRENIAKLNNELEHVVSDVAKKVISSEVIRLENLYRKCSIEIQNVEFEDIKKPIIVIDDIRIKSLRPHVREAFYEIGSIYPMYPSPIYEISGCVTIMGNLKDVAEKSKMQFSFTTPDDRCRTIEGAMDYVVTEIFKGRREDYNG